MEREVFDNKVELQESNLCFKETDRIKATVEGLRKMRAHIEEREDGMVIKGKIPKYHK